MNAFVSSSVEALRVVAMTGGGEARPLLQWPRTSFDMDGCALATVDQRTHREISLVTIGIRWHVVVMAT